MSTNVGTLLLFLSDIFFISTVSFTVTAIFREALYFSDYLNVFWILSLWILVLFYLGAYTKRFSFWDEIKLVWKSTIIVFILNIFSFFYINFKFITLKTDLVFIIILTLFFLFPYWRILAKRFIYRFGFLKKNIIIIGSGQMGKLALNAIKSEPNLGYNILGFIDDKKDIRYIEGYKVHGFLNKIDRYLKNCRIDDVVIAKPELKNSKLLKLVNLIQHKVDNILYIPEITGIACLGTNLRHFFNEQTLVIEVKNNLKSKLNKTIKRFTDYLISLLLLPFILIIMAVIYIAIKITSKGPAILKQDRIGQNGKIFKCYKFRTMYIDADTRLKQILETDPEAKAEWEKYWKLRNDPRVTKVGRFLRKTSLDELPQIFNVLKGEMSIVGPRPYLLREESQLQEYRDIILSVLPGITGLWQTSGRNKRTYKDRLILDAWYVRNWNLWLDIVILLKTITVVIKREGAC